MPVRVRFTLCHHTQGFTVHLTGPDGANNGEVGASTEPGKLHGSGGCVTYVRQLHCCTLQRMRLDGHARAPWPPLGPLGSHIVGMSYEWVGETAGDGVQVVSCEYVTRARGSLILI